MPPLDSYDKIIAALAAEQQYQGLWQKTHVASGSGAAGRWYNGFLGTGQPSAGSFSGSAGVAVALNDSSAGAMLHGGNVSTDEKRLIGASAWSPTSTAVPGTLWLVDMLLYYPGLSANTPTTLDNTVTLPRYTSGAGVMAFLTVTTALGAAAPSISLTYTNSTPTGSRTSGNIVAAANSLPTPTLLGTGRPFAPLQAGDLGIQSVQSYTINSGGTGTGDLCLVLCKPLAQIPIYAINSLVDRDYVTGRPTFPRIYDGACLSLLYNPGGNLINNALINAQFDFVWGD